jgi:hypothetical protein
MVSRWARLALAALAAAGPATAQQVKELGVQVTATWSDPALVVAGVSGAIRISERSRVSAAVGDGAWRGELLGHFLLAPRRRSGLGPYAAGGLSVVGGPVERGYVVLTLGIESRPGSRSGWFLELGVGGGARIAAGWRRRWFPAWWPLTD